MGTQRSPRATTAERCCWQEPPPRSKGTCVSPPQPWGAGGAAWDRLRPAQVLELLGLRLVSRLLSCFCSAAARWGPGGGHLRAAPPPLGPFWCGLGLGLGFSKPVFGSFVQSPGVAALGGGVWGRPPVTGGGLQLWGSVPPAPPRAPSNLTQGLRPHGGSGGNEALPGAVPPPHPQLSVLGGLPCPPCAKLCQGRANADT